MLLTVGQPRVGNASFAKMVDYLVPDYFRVFNEGDPVRMFYLLSRAISRLESGSISP